MNFEAMKRLMRGYGERLRRLERAQLKRKQRDMTPVGTMTMYAGSVAPAGYLLAVGGTVLIADYPAYAAVVGTTYGGNGTTTVGLPDMRGRVPVGMSSGDSDFGALNNAVGAKTHTLTTAQMPSHNHSITRPPWRTSERVTGSTTHAPNGTYEWFTQTAAGQGGIGNTGGGGAHNNIQPSRVLNFIIKV